MRFFPLSAISLCRFFAFLGLAARLLAGAEPALAQGCDAPAVSVVSTVNLPGAPFSAIPTTDGCTIFLSVNVQPDRAMPGHIVVLTRAGGQAMLARNIAVGPRGLFGMAISHDGKLLAAADNNG